MSELEGKLNSILSNPGMMQQIMSLAQSLNTSQSSESPKPPPAAPPDLVHGFDPALLAKLGSLMQHGAMDHQQQALLKALVPYLSRRKLQKLEQAMKAAKIAGMASELLGAKPNPFHS